MLEWGEEQAYYVLDNTANNYVFGRQPISSTTAWQDHGCYVVGNSRYATWPPGSYDKGCKDDWNSLDHRDPAHPIRNIMTTMFEMRTRYPVLNDGFYVETLSKQTFPIPLPGTKTPTETGIWSVLRSRWQGMISLLHLGNVQANCATDLQDFSGQGQGNQSVWLVYHNQNSTIDYTFDCSNETAAMIAPFDQGTRVKDLLYPFEEHVLQFSAAKLGTHPASVISCSS